MPQIEIISFFFNLRTSSKRVTSNRSRRLAKNMTWTNRSLEIFDLGRGFNMFQLYVLTLFNVFNDKVYDKQCVYDKVGS